MRKLVLILVLILSCYCFGDEKTSHQWPTSDSALDLGKTDYLWRYLYTDAITDGTASWSSNSLSGFTSISGTTLTDTVLSINAGSITSAVNGTFSGTLTAEQLTSTDDATITDDLTVGGDLALTGTLTVADITATGTVTGEQLTSTDDLTVTDTALIDGTLTLATGSITDSGGAISFGNENLTTTGLVTVGELNTTGVVGTASITKLASGIASASAPSINGIIEFVSDATYPTPTGTNAMLSIDNYFSAVNTDLANYGITCFNRTGGVAPTASKNRFGVYGGMIGTITGFPDAGVGVKTQSLYGLYFGAANQESVAYTSASAARKAIINTWGIYAESDFCYTGKTYSGDDVRATSYGGEFVSNLRGTFSSQDATGGLAYGTKITVNDALTDVGEGATLNSYGLHVTVPATGGKTGTFNSYAAVLGDGSSVATFQAGGHLLLPAGTATAGTAPLKFTSGEALTTPEAGALEFHDNRLYLTNVAARRAIDRTSCVETSTTTVANDDTEQTIYTCANPANSLKVGNHLHVKVSGIITNATAADDITINTYVGTDLIETFNPAIGNVTNADWHASIEMTVRTVGAAGTIATHGHVEIDGNEDTANELDTVDTTGANNITITVQWDNAKAGNIISLYQGVTHWSN
jgi:hypothetical protein